MEEQQPYFNPPIVQYDDPAFSAIRDLTLMTAMAQPSNTEPSFSFGGGDSGGGGASDSFGSSGDSGSSCDSGGSCGGDF